LSLFLLCDLTNKYTGITNKATITAAIIKIDVSIFIYFLKPLMIQYRPDASHQYKATVKMNNPKAP